MISKMTESELIRIIENSETAELHEYVEDVNAIDVARCAEDLDDRLIWKLCSMLEVEDLAKVLEQAEDDLRVRMADSITNEELLDVFSFMQKDDIVDIVGDIPTGQRKALVNLMVEGDRKIIRDLLQYPEDSAGGIMTTAYVSLRDTSTVSEGIERLRKTAPKTEVLETLFVVDAKHVLIGTVDLRDLLTASKNAKISTIMKENPVSIQADADQEEAAKLVSKYDLHALPVVTYRGVILGIITVDDIIDVIVEEYNEDIMEMAGVSKEESLETSLWESVRLRLPWLLVNLATAFLASLTVKMFEGTISQVVALSATMTIVSGMGGNAGSQTNSIMIRALAADEVTFAKYWKSLVKEIVLGVVNGAATGLITGIIVWLIYGNIYLGIIILIAMIGNLIVAGGFGFLVPLVLKKCGADPAVSSSIFLTTATDVLGFFIFLGLANMFLPLLV